MAWTCNRIVVGVDGSLGSLHALAWAVREASVSGAELEVLHVWSDPWSIAGTPSLAGAGKERVAEMRADLARWIEDAIYEEGALGVRVVSKLVAGDPCQALVEQSRDAKMLVIGRTGSSALGRLFVGSVSERCALSSHVAVVLVPFPEEVRAAAANLTDVVTPGG